MKQFRFRTFQVYSDARKIRGELKKMTQKKFPKEEQFCLTSQLWRALNSIILNIAEGSERGSDKDFAHFLNTSDASVHEVVACLDLARDDHYITEVELNIYLDQLAKIASQLTAFRKKLLNHPTK